MQILRRGINWIVGFKKTKNDKFAFCPQALLYLELKYFQASIYLHASGKKETKISPTGHKLNLEKTVSLRILRPWHEKIFIWTCHEGKFAVIYKWKSNSWALLWKSYTSSEKHVTTKIGILWFVFYQISIKQSDNTPEFPICGRFQIIHQQFLICGHLFLKCGRNIGTAIK